MQTAELQGTSIIGFSRSTGKSGAFRGRNAATASPLEPEYYSAGVEEVDRAVRLAVSAFAPYRTLPRARRAEFLRRIASRVESLGEPLLERVVAESALLPGRVAYERDRTCSQLRFFAGIAEEGSWVDARIDTGEPDRKPMPKPDVRSMLRPLGPVAVFCAANFPLAFSVAGGDTASALAAGNPVVVIAHFAHPGTAEMMGTAIRDAARETGMPEGVFSLLFSAGHEAGQNVVKHPGIRAVGFTGSRRGGMALFQLAQSRPEPIPFYAEMGSINAVFLLPGALQQATGALAERLHASINLAVGQYCTSPGVLVTPRGPIGDEFSQRLGGSMREAAPAHMLHNGILQNYRRLVTERSQDARVRTVAYAETKECAGPALFETDAGAFIQTPELWEEVFGPSSMIVRYGGADEALRVAASLEGNLTATIWAGPGDEAAAQQLVSILETKVGRIIFQGVPTTLEICQAMVHGGPFPATSDGRSTSVGGRAIERFARLVSFQDAPDALLPEELRDGNPAGIWRMVNGERKRG